MCFHILDLMNRNKDILLTMVIKILAIKVIMYILNQDMVEKRPRSAGSGINLYKS